MADCYIVFVEPFYGGSHKVLIETLTKHFEEHNIAYNLVTLSAKKWHWRARCGALQIYQKIPRVTTEKILFCSSVLNLCELIGLRPDLQQLKKIVYFHENQLVYPVQEIKSRDVQYAYNQITTCLAADLVIFNSEFNKDSFLNNMNKIIKLLPDYRPKDIKEVMNLKSKVLYFPVCFPNLTISDKQTTVLHIVWPHRWEFDKGPEDFFETLLKLKNNHFKFQLSVLGETFADVPEIFNKAKEDLKDEIRHFGFLDSKEDYFNALQCSHVVVSTAKHEFFGVSMLEAAYCGCFPLVPNDLVYPEIYPKPCLYSNIKELYDILKTFCLTPMHAMELRKNLDIDFNKYSAQFLLKEYMDILKF